MAQLVAPVRAGRRRSSFSLRRLLLHIGIIAGALLMFYPLLWMISASFKPQEFIFSSSSLLSPRWTLSNYIEGWTGLDNPFTTYYINSLIVCVGAIVGNILTCSMAAYAFARLRFKYKAFWFVIMQMSILLPIHVLIVPQYIIFKDLGWINTLLPMIVPKFLATDAFFIFLMIQFIRGIPRELDDSAKIDGCGMFTFYWRVIIPLSMPALVTTAIFTFIWTWSDFFAPLIFLNSTALYTVPVALHAFIDGTGNAVYGQLFAMSVLSLLPIFGFFLVFQRLLIEGTNTTGLKG